MPVEQMPVGQMPVGTMIFDPKSRNLRKTKKKLLIVVFVLKLFAPHRPSIHSHLPLIIDIYSHKYDQSYKILASVI
jgi:hypothetical protein